MRERIDACVRAHDPDDLLRALEGAELRLVRYAARRIAAAFRDQPDELFARLDKLIASPMPEAHALACQLIRPAFRVSADRALAALPLLIESEDWTIRDAACEVAGRLLREAFPVALSALTTWKPDRSENLARAVVVAVVRATDPRHPERAEPLLKLLEPLLSNSEPIVRRNLGPSALGTHLLAHYPTETFEYLVKWSTLNDAQSLWYVAMAFSGPAAAPIAKKALIVLRKLALDERRLVWRAVSSAVWKLGRRRPEIVRPELARWLEDERRLHVAREAIRHL